MFGFYSPILLLQAFCLYHAYKNQAQQMWYWIIIFFPVLGCIIYLYDSFYSKRSIKNIAEGVKEIVISNYRIEQLEKELRFSDTIANKINLGDAYVDNRRYKDAIDLYTDCLNGFMADDPVLRIKILQAHFHDKDYDATIAYGDKLGSEKNFKNAEERIIYAWALHYVGKTDKADAIFKDMDNPFTNYPHRKEYCRFLLETNKTGEAKDKLIGLLTEFDHMSSDELRHKRDIVKEIRAIYNSIAK